MQEVTPAPACTVEGCTKPARSSSAIYCKMHYHRWYRHGDPTVAVGKVPTPTESKGRRYKTRYMPSHPLASKHGVVYVHRQVLYDLIGEGEHACHWCGSPVRWAPKGTPGALVPDHLNGYGDDNRPENLVPSCMGCNTTRGQQLRSDALREAGWWSSHDTIDRCAAQRRRGRIVA